MTERRIGIKGHRRSGMVTRMRYARVPNHFFTGRFPEERRYVVLHTIEPAASGRAKCRGCGERIVKGELRFGERLENPFGEGQMTLWFHPVCGAYKRPEPFLQALDAAELDIESVETPAATGHTGDWLRAEAGIGLEHRRLPRLDGAGPAPTGRARCRACKQLIATNAWRIGLVYYEEGFFSPSGYIHAACARDYFEATELAAAAITRRIHHFSPGLSDADREQIEAQIDAGRKS